MKLNLGCGSNFMSGTDWINVDNWSSNPLDPKVLDSSIKFVHMNLAHFPWCFPSNSVDEILMMHVLEHLPDTYATMSEIKRVLKTGGIFWGQVPYGWSYNQIQHPQHCKAFVADSFKKLGQDFNFAVEVHNVRFAIKDWKWRLRNILVPPRFMEIIGLMGAYDVIDFKMTKL